MAAAVLKPPGFANYSKFQSNFSKNSANPSWAERALHSLGDGISDRFRAELQSLAKESNPEICLQGLLHLGVELGKHGELKAAEILFSLVRAQHEFPGLQKLAEQESQTWLGTGERGARFEPMLGNLAKNATDYRSIVPMMAGTVVGQFAKHVALGKLMGLSKFKAALASYALEVPAFTLASRLLGTSEHSACIDLRNAAFSLGAIKLAHAFSAPLAAKLGANHAKASAMALQAGTFLGLAGARKIESFLEPSKVTDNREWFLDTLATMLSLGIGARLGNSLFGGVVLAEPRETSAKPKEFSWGEWNATSNLAWNAAGGMDGKAFPIEAKPLQMSGESEGPRGGMNAPASSDAPLENAGSNRPDPERIQQRNSMIRLLREGIDKERLDAVDALLGSYDVESVQAVLDALRTEPEAGYRRYIVNRVGFDSLCRSEIADALIDVMNNDLDQVTRWAAVSVLFKGHRDHPKVRPLMLDAVKSPDGNIRMLALSHLNFYRISSDIALEIQALQEDPDPFARIWASIGLVRRGSRGIKPLVAALASDKDVEVRRTVATILAEFKSSRVVQALRKASMQDPDDKVRTGAEKSLKRIFEISRGEKGPGAKKEPTKVQPSPPNTPKPMESSSGPGSDESLPSEGKSALRLISEFHHQADGFLQRKLVLDLGKHPDRAARMFLLDLLNNKERGLGLRTAAAEALAGRNDLPASTELFKALHSANTQGIQLQKGIIAAMGMIPDGSAVADLIAIASDREQDGDLRTAALGAIGASRNPIVLEALLGFAGGDHPTAFRGRAISLLGKIGGTEALSFLSELTKDGSQNPVLRKGAIAALGRIAQENTSDPGATNALIAAVKTGDRPVRAAAATSLAAVRDPSAARALIQALRSEKDAATYDTILNGILSKPDLEMIPLLEKTALTHASAAMRGRAISAYAAYAGAGARQTLERIAQSELNEMNLRSAIYCLAEIGDVRSLPLMLDLCSRTSHGKRTFSLVHFDPTEVVKVLIAAFPSKNPETRATIVYLLAEIKDARIPAFLTGLVEDATECDEVLSQVASALSETGDLVSLHALLKLSQRKSSQAWHDPAAEAKSVLKRNHFNNKGLMAALLHDGSFEERVLAIQKLCSGRMDETNAKMLLGLLKQDPDARMRQFVAGFLEADSRTAVLNAMMDRFQQDPDLEVRQQALKNLIISARKNPRIRDLILGAMQDEQASIRAQAVYGLNAFRKSEDVDRQIHLLRNDPDSAVRASAASALHYRGKQASGALVAALDSDPASEVRHAAVRSLSNHRSTSIITALKKAAKQDANEMVREVARMNLIILGEKLDSK